MKLDNNITIIGIFHKDIETEIGKRNETVLYNIMKNINPNIVFIESNSTIENIFADKEKIKSIEFCALKRYKNNFNITIIPIDTLDEPSDFSDALEIIKFDEQLMNIYNKELFELINFIDEYTEKNGINGINTEYFDCIIEKRDILLNEYYNNLKKDHLPFYEIFNNYMCVNRENMMVNNIVNYINTENNYTAIVLIGAGHRKSIYNKLLNIGNIVSNLYYSEKPNGT